MEDVIPVHIFPLCDCVGLHVLYSTSRYFHTSVDKYVRARIAAVSDDLSGLSQYGLRNLPCSGLLLYGDVISSKWPWKGHLFDDLFENFSFSTLGWYGSKTVKNALAQYCRGRDGLKRLLDWRGKRSDDQLAVIVEGLRDQDLIPEFELGRQLDRLVTDEGRKDFKSNALFFYLILSGRVDLLKRVFDEYLVVAAIQPSVHMITAAILSDNSKMVRYFYQKAPFKDDANIVAAILTSDEMVKEITRSKKKHLIRHAYKVMNTLFYLRVPVAILERAMKLFPSFDKVEMMECIIAARCDLSSPVLNWLFDRQYLNQRNIKILINKLHDDEEDFFEIDRSTYDGQDKVLSNEDLLKELESRQKGYPVSEKLSEFHEGDSDDEIRKLM